MAVILSLETSTTICSAALHENGVTLACTELHIPQSASSKLAPLVDQLFALCGRLPSDIQAVAVSAGPGSYTGLRIGVATAKGLCFALSVPLLSVNTLELMAYQAVSSGVQSLLCPMLDARRMEVYCLLCDMRLTILEPTDARVIDTQSFKPRLEKEVITFFGNGAAKCRELIRHPNARFLENIYPSAAHLGEVAYRKFELNQFEDVSRFEPIYLKDFVVKKPKSA